MGLIVLVPSHCLSFFSKDCDNVSHLKLLFKLLPLLSLHNNIPDKIQSQIRLFADETVAYLTHCTPKHSPTPSNTWKRTWDMGFRLIRVGGD